MINRFRQIIKENSNISYCLLLLGAIITRFIYLKQTAFFLNDQGRDLQVLLEMVRDRHLTLIGPATSFYAVMGSLYFGPYYSYFLLPFFLINQSPLFMTLIFPTLFSLVVVLISFVPISKAFNQTNKIILLVLLISSSYSLYYTRFLWNLNLGLLLSTLLFLISLKYRRLILINLNTVFIYGLINGVIFQIHYAMLFMYLGLFVTYLTSAKQRFFYSIGFVLSFLPFVIFDLRHQHILLLTIKYAILDFFKFHSQKISFFTVFSKIFESYLFPGLRLNQFFMIIIGSGLFIAISIFLFKKRKILLFRLTFSMFVAFFLSFFLFRREFNHYLACFMFFFYLGLALLFATGFKKNLLTKLIVTIFLIIFSVYNLQHYFLKEKLIPYSIQTQEELAEAIHKYSKGKQFVFIDAKPHFDDRKSLEYLLVTKYKMEIKDGKNKFVVCYTDESCLLKQRNWELIKVIDLIKLFKIVKNKVL